MPANSSERNSPSVGLLISVLVRYPEIANVHYDNKDHTLRCSLILARRLLEEEVNSVRDRILGSLEAYFLLESRKTAVVELKVDVYDEISVLQIRRDVASLTQEEISMVTEIVRDMFPTYLVTEHGEAFGDEDPAFQEEIIEEMLDDLRQSGQQKNLVAFREEGRVLVYNK